MSNPELTRSELETRNCMHNNLYRAGKLARIVIEDRTVELDSSKSVLEAIVHRIDADEDLKSVITISIPNFVALVENEIYHVRAMMDMVAVVTKLRYPDLKF